MADPKTYAVSARCATLRCSEVVAVEVVAGSSSEAYVALDLAARDAGWDVSLPTRPLCWAHARDPFAITDDRKDDEG